MLYLEATESETPLSVKQIVSMNKLLYVCLAFTLLAFKCEKRLNTSPNNEEILGSWKLKETWMNPGGGPDIIQPAASNDLLLSLNNDGTVISNIDHYRQYARFRIVDHQKLAFIKKGSNHKDTVFYSFTSTSLRLARMGCIEGCGDVFIAIK